MTVLPLVIAPDQRLYLCSAAVESVDDELRSFMDDMLETMYANEGIGLAAVQVGVHKRVITMGIEDDKPYFIVNPEIIEKSEENRAFEEGCLSFPEQKAEVTRPDSVKIKYLDYDGKEQVEDFTGLYATCIQHEIDHINGVVFIDHVSRLRRDMVLRKMAKIKKLYKESDTED